MMNFNVIRNTSPNIVFADVAQILSIYAYTPIYIRYYHQQKFLTLQHQIHQKRNSGLPNRLDDDLKNVKAMITAKYTWTLYVGLSSAIISLYVLLWILIPAEMFKLVWNVILLCLFLIQIMVLAIICKSIKFHAFGITTQYWLEILVLSVSAFESIAYYISPLELIAVLQILCAPALYFLSDVYPLIIIFYNRWLDTRTFTTTINPIKTSMHHRRSSSTSTDDTIYQSPKKLFILKPQQVVLDSHSKRSDLRELLYKILATPALLEMFSEFLAAEYCVETLLFIQSIDQYRKIARMGNVGLLKLQRKRIVDEFLVANAINEMNIPFRMKVEACKKVEQLSSLNELAIDLFDVVDSHIKDSLIDNKITRFANSEAFRKHIF
ncbi:hypothetical protein HDV01_005656 [Terramyces sp. JEL0728]|nr:hypothetical protein HDV01_005656 [Terramyces sp. JEL0728]